MKFKLIRNLISGMTLNLVILNFIIAIKLSSFETKYNLNSMFNANTNNIQIKSQILKIKSNLNNSNQMVTHASNLLSHSTSTSSTSSKSFSDNRSSKRSKKHSLFDLMKFLNVEDRPEFVSPSSKNMSREQECSNNLKKEDGHNWSCKTNHVASKSSSDDLKFNNIKNPLTSADKPKINLIPLFCICSYEYDCDIVNSEMSFSYDYMKQLKKQNYLKKVKRGADYQCENVLKKKTKQSWSCAIKKETKRPLDKSREYFCKCFHKKSVIINELSISIRN